MSVFPGMEGLPSGKPSMPWHPSSLEKSLECPLDFERMLSPGASTCCPSPAFERQTSYGTDTFELGASHYDGLFPSAWDEATLEGDSLPKNQELQEDFEGAMWVTTVGCRDGEQEVDEGKTQTLLRKLADVQTLFRRKFGEELLDADSEAEEDEDGTLWMQVSGDGTSSSQQFEPPYVMKLSSLEQKLEDVKAAFLEAKLGEIKSLYFEKYGEELLDSEGEAEEDEDGAVWMQVSGDGTSFAQQCEPTYLLKLASLERKLEEIETAYYGKYDYAIILAGLEAKLGEVESLYCKKYGEQLCDADGEAEEDEEGAMWMQVLGEGTSSSQQFEPSYVMKLASLEQKLEDVKTAYLDEKLGEIKCLYLEKYGVELLDSEGEAVEDEDGAMWTQVSGDGTSSSQQLESSYVLKLASLEQKLEDVKTAYLEEKLGEIKCLYLEKYGEELLDSEGEAVEDEDGAVWMRVSGDGTSSSQQFELTYCLNLAGLEQKLEDVKTAYLEKKLGEVKCLYLEKYGEELLDSEDEAVEDEDGATWIQLFGNSTSTSQPFELTYRLNLASLEQKLGDVKIAYCSKYSYGDNLAGLEEKLGEIESLFAKKYGQELEDAAGEEGEDEDGALWTKVVGKVQEFELRYLVKLAGLEQKLEDVKMAYCSKYGSNVDADEVMVSKRG